MNLKLSVQSAPSRRTMLTFFVNPVPAVPALLRRSFFLRVVLFEERNDACRRSRIRHASSVAADSERVSQVLHLKSLIDK